MLSILKVLDGNFITEVKSAIDIGSSEEEILAGYSGSN